MIMSEEKKWNKDRGDLKEENEKIGILDCWLAESWRPEQDQAKEDQKSICHG
jgi:hypothetical protein